MGRFVEGAECSISCVLSHVRVNKDASINETVAALAGGAQVIAFFMVFS